MCFCVDKNNQFVSIGTFFNVQNEIVYSTENIGNYIILMDNHHSEESYIIDMSTLASHSYRPEHIFSKLDYSQLKKYIMLNNVG